MMWFERLLGQRHAHPQEQLSAYIDGAMSAAEARRIEAHLAVCSVCPTQVEELRAVRASLRALPEPALRRSFTLTAADVAPINESRRSNALWVRSYTYGRAASVGLAMMLIVLLGIDLLPFAMPSGRGTGIFSESQATSGESNATANKGADTALSEADMPPQPAAAPAQRANSVPPSATEPAAGVAAFSATPPQSAATPSPAIRESAGEQPTPAGQPQAQVADSFDQPEAPAATGWSNLRMLEIIVGAVLILATISTLYLRARVGATWV